MDDQFVKILSDSGIRYTVADQVALERYLGKTPSLEELHSPWARYGVLVFFRDVELSNWVGFAGSARSRAVGEEQAAQEFLALLNIRLTGYVVVALDGENRGSGTPTTATYSYPRYTASYAARPSL